MTSISIRPTVASFTAVALAALAFARGEPQGQVTKLPEFGLSITLPAALTDVKTGSTGEQVKASWSAKLGESRIDIALYALDLDEFSYDEPEDVTDNVLENFRRRSDETFSYEHTDLCNGAFGFAPYGAVGWGPVHDHEAKSVVGGYYVLGGLLEKYGYALEVVAEPAVAAANEAVLIDFLKKGVAYQGKQRNAKWTDDEAKARWVKDAPTALHGKFEKPVRSAHYIVLSNTPKGAQLTADAMEACYTKIQKTFPFPEVAGRRLMPVFLFRDNEEYFQFFAKAFNASVEDARKSKGVASRDFYSTYYDAPQDPVHIHEATHQIFHNRLRLPGGGSWFQEGVAEYICTRSGDRATAASVVKKGREMKLAEFVKIPSLLYSAKDDKKGGNEGTSHYELAALLIEFLHESKFSKDHFLEWIHAVGNTPRNNLAAIERATKGTLGVDLAGLEAKWVEYCKTR